MITEPQPHLVVLQLTDTLLAQQLTMAGEVYDALVARVGSALDYDIRWQPNEYEPDSFVERVHPPELMGASHMPVDCSACEALLLANREAVLCACG